MITAVAIVVVYQSMIFFVQYYFRNRFYLMGMAENLSWKNQIIISSTQWIFVHVCLALMLLLLTAYYIMSAVIKDLEKAIDGEFDSNIIQRTSTLYLKLCDVFACISQIFFVMNLLIASCFIYCNIIVFYTLFVYYKNQTERMQIYATTTPIFAEILTPCVFFVYIVSSKIISQAHESAELIQKIAMKNKNVSDAKKAFNFALLVAHRQPVITTGLYQLNWKSLFMLFGSIFSYTIIIIQFHDV